MSAPYCLEGSLFIKYSNISIIDANENDKDAKNKIDNNIVIFLLFNYFCKITNLFINIHYFF